MNPLLCSWIHTIFFDYLDTIYSSLRIRNENIIGIYFLQSIIFTYNLRTLIPDKIVLPCIGVKHISIHPSSLCTI